MRAQCSEMQYANVSVVCLERYLTADDVREGLQITDSKSADDRIKQAFEWVLKMFLARHEAGRQLCMAFKQTNKDTFFALVKNQGLSEELAKRIMSEVYNDTLQEVWNAKTKE